MDELTNRQTNYISYSANYYKQWLQYIDASPKTVATYTRAIKQFSNFLNAEGITSPTREDIIRYRDTIKIDHKANTVNAYLMAVKQFFGFLAQQGLYQDVTKKVKAVKVNSDHKKEALTKSEVKSLIASIDTSNETGARDKAIIMLCIATGLRTTEVINSDIQDLKAIGDKKVLYILGKGRQEKDQFIVVPEACYQAIAEYLKYRPQADITAPLFTATSNRNINGRLTTKSVSRLVKEHLKDININDERFTAHSLRHTTATQALLNGASLQEVQQVLRHQNINTTLIYVNHLNRLNNNTEQIVANALFD